MTTSHYRLLRLAILVMGVAYTDIFLIRLIARIGEDLLFLDWVFLVRGVILMCIGIVIAIKLPRTNEHIFFALFLVNFALYSWLASDLRESISDTLAWSATAGSFIYAMIVYPGTSAASLYWEYFAAKRTPLFYKRAILFFTQAKHFWLIFFPVLIGARALAFSDSDVIKESLNILVVLSGLVYFRISYNLAGKTDRSRLAWILWGAIVSLVLTLVDVLIKIFYPAAPPIVSEILIALTAATICISIIMGVFFAGFLDTGLVLRGTIVYSAIFLSVVFLFSFVEHFIEHEIAAIMHIENDMVSAFLAGFLALLIQPLHKKLEHILPKF